MNAERVGIEVIVSVITWFALVLVAFFFVGPVVGILAILAAGFCLAYGSRGSSVVLTGRRMMFEVMLAVSDGTRSARGLVRGEGPLVDSLRTGASAPGRREPQMLTLASNLEAARSQMAFTLGFHIILASLGVALPAMMLIANYRGPAPRRRGRAAARAALVEGGGGHVRGRRRDGHRAVVRVRAAVAGVHRALRRGLRRAVRDRGHLLLPRGDLHRDLHLRLEAPGAVDALLVGRAGRDHGPRRRVLGRRRELVDEPAAGLLADDRRGHLGRAAEGDLQPGGALRGAAHDPGGVSRHRVPRRLGLRGRDAARPARPHPSPRAADPADGRLHRDADPVRGRRHGRASDRQGPADQVRGDGVRADDLDRRDGVHLRPLHVERREGRDRDPRPRLVPGRLEHRARR